MSSQAPQKKPTLLGAITRGFLKGGTNNNNNNNTGANPRSKPKGTRKLTVFGGQGKIKLGAPEPGEKPLTILRVRVLGCQDLLAADSNGSSDPFVVVSMLGDKKQTQTKKKTLNPVYGEDATYDFPIYRSVVNKLQPWVELVAWDSDLKGLRKDYLGEASIAIEHWFGGADNEVSTESGVRKSSNKRAAGYNDEGNAPFSVRLVSTRAHVNVTGSIKLKIGFVAPPNEPATEDYNKLYESLVVKSRPSLVSPPTRGVGTIRSIQGLPQSFPEDDGGISSSGEEDDDEGSEDEDEEAEHEAAEGGAASRSETASVVAPISATAISGRSDTKLPISLTSASAVAPPVKPSTTPAMPTSPTSPTSIAPQMERSTSSSTARPITPRSSAGILPRFMKFGLSSHSGSSSSGTTAAPSPASTTPLGANVLHSSISSSTPPSITSSPVQSTVALPSTGAGAPLVGLGINGTPTALESDVAERKKKAKFSRKSWITSGSGGTQGNDGSSTPGGDTSPDPEVAETKGRKRKGKGGDKSEFRLDAGGDHDIVGIVMLEIQNAKDLPKWKNAMRTGWDMDPFVVVSFGKKVFRTRVIRHSLSPVWEEKLLFHVRRYETNFKIQLSILDWDKLSSNDYIGDASLNVQELIQEAPQIDEKSGLYDANVLENRGGAGVGLKEYSISLKPPADKANNWEGKHKPTITFKAKYQPYDALRQQFWSHYLKQYDTDDTNSIDQLELISMLDSLGSTLSRETIESFWTRFGKRVGVDQLEFGEVIQCLEKELGRPDSEKKMVKTSSGADAPSGGATPVLIATDREGKEVQLDALDFTGPGGHDTEPAELPLEKVALPSSHQSSKDASYGSSPGDDEGENYAYYSTTEHHLPPPGAPAVSVTFAEPEKKGHFKFIKGKKGSKSKPEALKQKSRDGTLDLGGEAVSDSSGGGDSPSPSESAIPSSATYPSATVERVITVNSCPLCHRPRMSSKAEVDIITHMAVCASQDWNKVDRIMVSNFVTANQAQRKWYTKVMSKISSGDYKIGANSANIIVQNRMTGQLEEEKMQVYVRLGIRLLYKGGGGTMEGARARKLLKSMSIKQGIKFDAPESAKEIPGFIEFHNLIVEEILDPLDSFKSFNEFFYRKLKPEARPIEESNNPYRVVSGADCRLMAFSTVHDATKIWIKGREFTVSRLLGDAYKNEAERYNGGALAIFRLAPQDYHRFHCPVDGVVGKMTYIAGEYYTVNPQAIRTALDVYGENARKIVPFDSPQFGRVMAVCVGAMMVGSIQTTVEEGQRVQRGEEFGYFAFGGSTIVLLFEKGMVEWDGDLLENSRQPLETLVRVGMGIGRKI